MTGVQTCALPISLTLSLFVLFFLSVSASPSDTVLISTDVTLRCDVGGDSTAQVQWMKPPSAKPYRSSGNTVTLNSVTSADAGEWICQIKDNTGKDVEKIGQVITVVGLCPLCYFYFGIIC